MKRFAMISVSLISVVDDDESVRESLEGLLKSVGFRVEAFALAGDFLNSKALHNTDCLILDVRMPGMSGPELQRKLIASQHLIPIIFITAHGDEAVRARVLADGAVDCLLKPFSEDGLLNAVHVALGRAGAESETPSGEKSMR
jgi:FixJ family two-component response regulator